MAAPDSPAANGAGPASAPPEPPLDVLIIGAGIGGVISLKYARDAGLRALALEKAAGAGGLWRDLPAWQDIQLASADWTLGAVPIGGHDQRAILANIEAWVERFGLRDGIRLDAEVLSARHEDGGWRIRTRDREYRARYVVAATGGHNLPFIPPVAREAPQLDEFHSSALRDPAVLAGRDVTVVGGGASAFDLLDLALDRGAARVRWVYRSVRWMLPTLKAKHEANDLRTLGKRQLLGATPAKMNPVLNGVLRSRYRKYGLEPILPQQDFDIRRNHLLPGRRGMIGRFADLDRYQSIVTRIAGRRVELASGASFETGVLLWGTGYTLQQRYFAEERLSGITGLAELSRRCGSIALSRDVPGLFFLAPGVLEANTSTPWAYAHLAKSIMAHIRGKEVFTAEPAPEGLAYLDVVRFLAGRDRASYLPLVWRLKYLARAFLQRPDRPLPLP